MLYFYKHRIYFYLEMNTLDEFLTTESFPYCKASDLKNLFPNITLFDTIDKATLTEQSGYKFLLTPEEFRGFVEDWVAHCTVNKLYNWDGAVFFIEYINTLKQIAKIDADYQFDGKWEGDVGLYNEEKINLLEKIDVSKKVASPIIINSQCEPELSMKIEDVLYALKHNTTSLYTNEINNLINYNIRRMGLTKALYENFSAGKDQSIFDPNKLDLSQDITIKDIDYSNPNCIFYFYYYSFLPGIRTNLVHLKRVLGEMAK